MEGSMTLTDLAVHYASLNIKVFPVRRNAMGRKIPLSLPGVPNHGFKNGTTDLETVRAAFEGTSATMIGAVHDFATIVDIDSAEGERNFKTIEHRMPKPKAIVRTKKGRHLYYHNPKNIELKRHTPIIPGVDLLAGPNGYVNLPDGVNYVLESGSIESLLETK